jgi:hypothetical protein
MESYAGRSVSRLTREESRFLSESLLNIERSESRRVGGRRMESRADRGALGKIVESRTPGAPRLSRMFGGTVRGAGTVPGTTVAPPGIDGG